MIKSLEKTGRTEDAAVQAALEELKLDRDDVAVEILQRAKSGFLGIGASPAVVRVSYEVPDPKPEKKKKEPKKAEKKPELPKKTSEAKPAPAFAATDENKEFSEIRSFLTGLFEKMGVSADINITSREGGGIDVILSGDDMGAIIGRRGETLDAIQHLTNYAVNHGNDKRMHINLDAESYRAKREESLTKLAEKMAEKAIKYKRSMALEPMNSYERHVIHSALQDYEGVTTASSGEEPNRRVIVTPVKTGKEAPEKVEKSPAKPKKTVNPAPAPAVVSAESGNTGSKHTVKEWA